jgi:hypothetical protein
MIRAFLLIFAPGPAWERILRVERGIALRAAVYLLPLLVLASAGEAYGLVHWGKWQGVIGRIHKYSVGEAVLIEALQILLSLLLVAVNAAMIKAFGDTFRGRHTYAQSLPLAIYSLTPLFVLRVLDGFSRISPLMVWAVGILLCLRVLYPGVPRVMDPDPPNAFGIYVMSAILMGLTSGLVYFIATWYFQGKFAELDSLISSWGARLF